jgi:dTDP-4-dehydrorhamnose 3,5-epimerase
MNFAETELKGAYLVSLQKIEDERGFFARAWCQHEFEEHGLKTNLAQANVSFSKQQGTLRGLHFQRAPYQEAKLIRCTRGSIYDVIVDLRPESPTFKRWFGVELKAGDYKMLYVPEGFAQGLLTLEDNTEIMYPTTEFYTPEAESGVRFDDPAFAIVWPQAVKIVSDKDRSWPDFVGEYALKGEDR